MPNAWMNVWASLFCGWNRKHYPKSPLNSFIIRPRFYMSVSLFNCLH